MKTPFIVGLGFLLTANLTLACIDPVLKTNTNPKEVYEAYRRNWLERGKGETQTRPEDMRGAAKLRVRKEDCFLYPLLRPEAEMSCLGPLIRSYERLTKRNETIQTGRNGKEVKLTVHIIGTGKNKNVLVCVPGVMSDHREYRYVVGALGAEYDFWVIDPPGCGESEAPDPKTLGEGGYSPEAMAERELQAIDELAKRNPQARIQIVAHSLGGLVVLRAFADPDLRLRYGDVLNRIDGLILISPCSVFMSQPNSMFISRSELSGRTLRIGEALGVVREKVAAYLVNSFQCSHCLPREEVDHAVEVIMNPRTRRAFQAMLRQALPFDLKTHQPKIEEMNRLEACYTNVNVPVRILWGKCDQTLPVYMGHMLEHRLPNARLTEMPDCRHAPNLERPEECARLIRIAYDEIAAERLKMVRSPNYLHASQPMPTAMLRK